MVEATALTFPPITRPLRTPASGLTEAEVVRRRTAGQGNDVRPRTSRTYWDILRQNAYPAINGVLFSVALLLMLWGLHVEALVTAGPVAAVILVGVVQEGRAKRALDQIALVTRPRAAVVRDGVELAVDPAELVLGDLVVARRGDQVVLDGVVVGGGRADLDESLLTGESDPVDRGVGEQVWSGSAVVAGSIVYEATAVGAATLAGRILREAKDAGSDRRTTLQREVAVMIWVVAALVAVAAVPVAWALREGGSGTEEALGAAAVLVSLVPQGLAIMITFTYAAGALRVTRMGALVQRQNAIESLSRVTTLCVDKTGTLTTPRLAFQGADALGGDIDEAGLHLLLGSVAAATSAPNRTTGALAEALPVAPLRLSDEVPFSSERRWSAVMVGVPGEALVAAGVAPGDCFVVGALPDLLPAALLAPGEGTALPVAVAAAAARGERVLVVGRAVEGSVLRDSEGRPALPPIVPLAVLRFVEEVRPDAPDTLAAFRAAGVGVRIISGDDPATVAVIGRRVGLAAEVARAGPDLEALDDAALDAALESAVVVGRVGPALKARLVDSLRRGGHHVAMVGDGVNDIVSLHRANLGIAMESGSAATRAVADIVLVGDRFAVLPRAVVEGQRIVAAMGAVLALLLTRTFAMVAVMVGTALAGFPVPVTPRQNSELAFVAVGAPLLVLAFLVAPRRPPRHLLREALRLSIPAGLSLAAVSFVLFAVVLDRGWPLAEARTALVTLMVFCGLGVLPLVADQQPPARRPRGLVPWPWWLAAALVVAHVGALATPPLRDFFGMAQLEPVRVASVLGVAVAWTALANAVRALDRRVVSAPRGPGPPAPDTPSTSGESRRALP